MTLTRKSHFWPLSLHKQSHSKTALLKIMNEQCDGERD